MIGCLLVGVAALRAGRLPGPELAVLALTPLAASQIVARCSFFGSRSQPKIHSPRKVDSRKNASSPSMANGAPKMSPTKAL